MDMGVARMKLHDVVMGPWAITPEMFSEIRGLYARHLAGDKIDLKGLEARIGAPLNGSTRGYSVENGVAVLPIDGVIAKRMNLMMQICGGTSSQLLMQDFQEALADPDVQTIILNIDSPGGTVDGTQEAANLIRASRGQKPVIALADGTMASAAYWIGSAADQVFVSSDTAAVGSIGVVASHTDVSGAQAKEGVKTTEISAGKYKRIASQYEPLTPEGRQSIQDQVDYTYSIFVNDVAQNRGVTPDTVLEKMADGRIFFGQQAVDAGLADGVSTLAELIARAQNGEFKAPDSQTSNAASVAGEPLAESENHPVKESDMNVEKLKAEHPAVAEALIAEGRQAGAAAERQRIKDVEAAALPGHEALIASLKFDGKTTGGDAALQVLAAEKAKRGDRLAALQADAAEGANKVPNAATDPAKNNDDEDDNEDAEEDASASPSGGQPKKKAKLSSVSDAYAVSQKAMAYQDAERAAGRKISAAQAVAHVMNGGK